MDILQPLPAGRRGALWKEARQWEQGHPVAGRRRTSPCSFLIVRGSGFGGEGRDKGGEGTACGVEGPVCHAGVWCVCESLGSSPS